MEKKRILVVDDEEDLCEILRFNLNSAGYLTDVAFSAEEAFAKLKNNYDLLLLDVMLGGITGFKLAELIREEYHDNVPIIFITARDSVDDKLKGFNTGADDYILKPFSVKEVVARVQAVLSRTEFRKRSETERIEKEKNQEKAKKSANELLVFSDMVINSETKQLSINGRSIKLTKKEFEILHMLAVEPQKIFSRAHILDLVWKNEAYVLDRTVDVHIARLRKKLGEYSGCIVNRSGYGYCFEINGKN
jgi:two-component system, OmpR family, alkaline phosphatase synthesis response regulator PhoP